MAVNYESNTAKVYKLSLNFMDNSSQIQELQNEVGLVDAMNFLIAVLTQ